MRRTAQNMEHKIKVKTLKKHKDTRTSIETMNIRNKPITIHDNVCRIYIGMGNQNITITKYVVRKSKRKSILDSDRIKQLRQNYVGKSKHEDDL